MTNKHDKMLR